MSGPLLKGKFKYMLKAHWLVDNIGSDSYFVTTVVLMKK